MWLWSQSTGEKCFMFLFMGGHYYLTLTINHLLTVPKVAWQTVLLLLRIELVFSATNV